MKTRFKYWDWKSLIPTLIGVLLLSLAMGYTNSQIRERQMICNSELITGCER